MTSQPLDPVLAQIGRRLREARLHAGLTVRVAATGAGLRAHGTLVQYENGHILPPLDRLALLAHVYGVPLSSLVVSNDALMPVVALLEHAGTAQVSACVQLLEHATVDASGGASGI